ncbi:LuxR family transcriptional regulator [Pseudonocardiaceae bacterium YIM PH 21723]|nr:LuxR family transcriptional regulator [Pseudonocardiaceae bacterium YIM PH 21723]
MGAPYCVQRREGAPYSRWSTGSPIRRLSMWRTGCLRCCGQRRSAVPSIRTPRLAGRDTELATLLAAALEPPSLILLSGEPGIGKTRLLRELAAEEALRSRTVLTTACRPLHSPLPLGPILDVLPGVISRNPADLSPVTAALRTLLPEVAHLLPTQTFPQDRRLVFHAIRELLGNAVLLVDDVQWADPDTADLLQYLGTAPPPGLCAILSSRTDLDLPGRHIRLGPLAADAVAELHGPGAVRRLLDYTAGIPGLLADPDSFRTPDLSPQAHEVLAAAAVLDEPADTALLAQVAGRGLDWVRVALTEALDTAALTESEPGRYGFRHRLARSTAYQRIGGPQREVLHTRALRALRRTGNAGYTTLAEHAWRAGRQQDWLRYGELAADDATTRGDLPTAIELLRRLLEPGSAEVDRLAVKLARIAALGLNQVQVSTLLSRLLTDDRLSAGVRGEIRLGLGLLLIRQDNGVEQGRRELETAVGELGARPDLAARAITALAEPYFGIRPISEVEPWLRRSEQALVDCDDQRTRLMLLANLIPNRVHLADPIAQDMVRWLPDRAETPLENRELARAHCNLADAYSWLGHHERARAHLELGLEPQADYVRSIGVTTGLRLDWYAGHWRNLARDVADQLAEHPDLLPVATELQLVLGWLSLVDGDWDTAANRFQATGLATPANAITPVVLSAHAGLITMRPGCRSTVDDAIRLLRGKGSWQWAGELVHAAVTAHCRADRLGAAEELLGELRRGIDGRDAPRAAVAITACRAEITVAGGDFAGGAGQFEAASGEHERIGLPYPAMLLAEQAALCRVLLGEPTGTTRLGELAERFDELGAARDAARCRHLLRGRGTVTASRRGRRSYGNELSPRERDVARLLAAERTNGEIAEVLFLSKRTVEQHVAKVLRKLGAQSRADLVDPGLRGNRARQ